MLPVHIAPTTLMTGWIFVDLPNYYVYLEGKLFSPGNLTVKLECSLKFIANIEMLAD